MTLAPALSVITSTYYAQRVREQTRALVENATESVDLLTRIGNTVNQLHAHVLTDLRTGTPGALTLLEQDRQRTERMFYVCAGRYDPLAVFPGEHETWRLLHAGVVEYLGTLQRVIVLAREGNTAAAEVLV